MIKNTVNSGAYTSGNIPLTNVINTNSKYSLDNNEISIHLSGITNVIANVIVTATADGTLTLQLYGDGVAIIGATDTQTLETGQTSTFHINDVVRTVYQQSNAFANITLAISGACTLVGGDVIAEYVR